MKEFLICVVLCVLISCKKDGSVSKNSANVYIAGYLGTPGYTTVGTYWENASPISFPQVGGISSIAVSGTDIYLLSGATYWKNGQPVNIAGALGTKSILVAGQDVYVIGYTLASSMIGYGGTAAAIYWKNGVEINLTNHLSNISDAFTTSIAVSGTDVYVGGYIDNQAVYWKNGNINYLTDGYMAKAIAISGTDIYVAGTSLNSGDVYWKNGVEKSLGNNATVTSMTASGGDVYIAGFTGGAMQAVYWKSGNLINLPNGYIANGIAVSGSDIFVAGNDNGGNAVYWKNSIVDTLGQGVTTSIVIGN